YCRAENMAAVTFTRKAAGELREKFQLHLEEIFRQEEDPDVKKRLGEALEKIERSFVGTIHSFCSRLLRERPVEAGISPDFTEIEGLEERLLEELAWEEYLLEVRFQRPELLQQLGELDLSPGDLKEAFQKLNRYPDVEMVFSSAPYPQLDGAREKLAAFCRLAGKLLPLKQPPKGWDNLQRTARLALRWQRMFDLQQDRYLLRLLERMDRNAGVTFNRWFSREHAEELAAAFTDFRENELQPALKVWLEYRHCHLMSFLLPAAASYRELRRRENKLNYQDLLMQAAALLKSNPEVRGYFQETYTHLLVDEFQDTDPIQAEVMFYLSGTDLSERDWTKLNPRPGSLFVVGDPKQSIYRFRRADIDTYYRVKDMIAASGGEVLHLTSNFRSLPELIGWTNHTFDRLFSPLSPPYQAGFVPMDEVRKKEQGITCGVFRLELEGVERHRQEEIAREDARRIAEWIRRSLDGGLALSRTPEEKSRGLGERPVPGDFLVLVHYKAYMSLYARALEACGIPFTLSGGGDISEAVELKELCFLLQALADPDNPVPLVAALRGLFFGISDALLYRFRTAGGQFSFLRDIPPDADQEVKDTVTPAWETLRRFWRWTRELPPSSALEKIVSELGLLPLALAGELGKGRAGYILQALELLRHQERQGETAFPRAVDFLLRLLEEGAEEELDIEGGGTSAVRIMNLHKAKGLEAPVVILANPGRSFSHEPELHVTREAEKPRGYLVIEAKEGPFRYRTLALPPGWDRFQQEEKKYQEAEASRLLYVAATRAKNLLVISTYPQKPEKSPWYPLEQFLAEEDVLPLVEPAPLKVDGKKEPITLSMLEEARENIESGIKVLTFPTYTRLRATDPRSEKDAPKRSTKGRGREWGLMIHAALEALIRSSAVGGEEEREALNEGKLQALVEELLQKEGYPSGQIKELPNALREITSSAFWQRVCNAPEKHAEVPFGIWEEDTYITGIIDLAFRREEGWVLVDYKTDAVEDDSHLQALVEYYTPQLELYRRYWEKITGEKVTETGLFFTDNLRHVKIT
ncbi:MAG: hypothetical protein AVO34_12920, partial [Firmicutes bacterium ML8_F2]